MSINFFILEEIFKFFLYLKKFLMCMYIYIYLYIYIGIWSCGAPGVEFKAQTLRCVSKKDLICVERDLICIYLYRYLELRGAWR